MATTKKGKKPSKPKSGSKPKKKSKKNTSGNVFTKIMLLLLLLAILCTAVFMILTNIKSEVKDKDDKTEITIEKKDAVDESREQKTEIKKTEIKEETPAEKKEVKKEVKKEEVAPKEEVKSEVKKDAPIVKDEKPKTEPKPEIIDLKKEFKENHSIMGCWLSSSQGASLTLDDYGYRIDFFGVDASQPMTGKYSAENNQIIFLTEDGDCKGIEGIYRISFDKKNISLTCKDDDCKKRKNVLETEWEWIEI